MNRPLNLIRILQIFPTHAMVMLVSSRTKELYDSNLDQRITNLSGLQWILKTPYQELLLVIELVIVGEIFDICYHCVWLNSLQKTEVMNAWSCNFLVNNFQEFSSGYKSITFKQETSVLISARIVARCHSESRWIYFNDIYLVPSWYMTWIFLNSGNIHKKNVCGMKF